MALQGTQTPQVQMAQNTVATPGVQSGQMQPEKSGWLKWAIIAGVAVIVIGVLVYFFFLR
ncbi:MAG: hypothetical protein ABIA78_03045 [archaeon]